MLCSSEHTHVMIELTSKEMLVRILYATSCFYMTVLSALFMIETLATASEICHVHYLFFLFCRRESIFWIVFIQIINKPQSKT